MNENHNNGRGVFYGVIGVATLVVAIIGATFAYFTATQSNNTSISGNAASVSFGLQVERITNPAESKGLIPMSNTMVEQAVQGGAGGTKGFCVDDADNLVCQIYKVTVTNSSPSSMFLDGYVTLHDNTSQTSADVASAPTIMRWAQVFATTESNSTTYSTGGETTLGADDEVTIASIGNSSDTTGKNVTNIYVDGSTTGTASEILSPATEGSGAVTFNGGTVMQVIKKNYIRLSQNQTNTGYTRSNLGDALVFSQYLAGSGAQSGSSAELYFVVWMAENATDQTLSGAAAEDFFDGNVTFLSGSGGEVSATFSGLARVSSSTAAIPAQP